MNGICVCDDSTFISDEEIRVAEQILNAPEDETITIMYDTTTRNKIEGEWIAFLVHFGKQKVTLRLRAIPLLFEDRDNIVCLFVEQMKRLAIAVNCHPVKIWRRITAIMTDSVSKNLRISEQIADVLYSDLFEPYKHVPYQLLCSAHWCENVDKKCLEVCAQIEEKLDLKQQLLKKMPGLAAFIRGKKIIVEIAIEACTSLVLNTGKKTSMYKDFNRICEEDNLKRKMGGYKQRRFTKLGYCAGTIVHHLPQFKKLVSTSATNLHSQAVKLYLEQDYIIDAMVCLAKITETVTLPFLEMVQKSTHPQLLQILPQLFTDLQNNRLSTLAQFHTPFKFNYPPINESQNSITRLMTKAVSEGLKLQRGREYGFNEDSSVNDRATALFSIPTSIIESLPTHNLDCERELAIFDRKVSKAIGGYNQNATFKGLRDEMILYKTNISLIPRGIGKTLKELDRMEARWYDEQLLKETARRTTKQNSVQKSQDRFRDLLMLCQTWGGPCTSIDLMKAVESTIGQDEMQLKRFFRTEIILNRLSNFHGNLNYGVNSKTIDELREILMEIIRYEDSLDSTEFETEYSHQLDDIMSQQF